MSKLELVQVGMNFEQFCGHVKDHIREYLPEDLQIKDILVQNVQKSNGRCLYGLVIFEEGSTVSPTLYLEEAYRATAEIGVEAVMKQIAETYMEHRLAGEGFDPSVFLDWSKVKDHILPRLVQLDESDPYMQDKPYTKILDMACVYDIMTAGLGVPEGRIAITSNMVAAWSISKEELHMAAIHNNAQVEYFAESMESVMRGIMCAEMPEELADGMLETAGEESGMVVITNAEKCNGAAVVLSDAFMKHVKEQVGEDLIILPSSVHEVIALPSSKINSDFDVEAMREMVQEINDTQVAPAERLSYGVYKYSDAGLEKIA